jgi:hypothetical protein
MISVRCIAPALLPLFAYGVAVLWLTWPLGAMITTHLPNTAFSCPFDPLLLAWALAHESRTLFTAPGQLFHANIFHPDPYALLYGETGIGALPCFMPVFLLTGNPALALNATFLGSTVLTASVLHWVVARWTLSALAGGVAAAGFLLTRWVLWTHAPCVPTYALLQYLPLILLVSCEVQSSRRRALLLAALVVLQGLSNAYLALAVLVPLLLLSGVRLARPAARIAALQSLAAVGIAALVLFVLYSGHLLLRGANPQLLAQTWWGMRLETKLPFGPLSYMTPLGVPLVIPVLAVLGTVAVLGSIRENEVPRRVWGVLWLWTISSALLSLPPVAWWGAAEISVPYLALPHRLGLYDVIRIPDRFGAGALIALCVLGGLAFAECGARLSRALGRAGRAATRAALAASVIGLAYLEYVHGAEGNWLGAIRAQGFKVRFPGADRPFDPPPPFLHVRRLPPSYPLQRAASLSPPMVALLRGGRGALLEVPVGAESGGTPALQARAQYRSITHRRPLVNGYSGYYPREFPARMALARGLPDPLAVARLRLQTGLTSILVHLDELPPEERHRWLQALVGRADLALVHRDGNQLLFALTPIAAAP